MNRVNDPSSLPVPFGGPQLVVLDTGVLYNDIVYRLRHPDCRGVLVGSAHTGATVLLAADHVYDEIYDSLTGHERRGVDRDAVLSCFEEAYLPRLRFVTMPTWPMPARAIPVAARDPDDAPTAALALLVAPSLVFAVDPHLVEAGFGRAEDWLQLTWRADELLGYDGTLMLSGTAARRIGEQVLRGGRWLMTDLRPAEIAVGVGVALLIMAAVPRVAAALTDAVDRSARQLGHAAVGVTTVLLQVAADRGSRSGQLHAASVAPDTPLGLPEHLARVLAVAREPIPANHLAGLVHQPLASVSDALVAHPGFVQTEHGWQFGRRRLPRNRELERSSSTPSSRSAANSASISSTSTSSSS